ncbi:MAG: hypothetical protein EA378_06370 [Phycisphaerales bacterium]|nr:MAG: hypothetical protein EA378_06370 [Phycisphaerales bacterium]
MTGRLPNPFDKAARRGSGARRFRGVFLGLRLLLLGGTLLVGSVAIAGVRFYIDFAESWAGSIDGPGEPPPDTAPRAWLLEHVIASGDPIMLLFWAGVTVAATGLLLAIATHRRA